MASDTTSVTDLQHRITRLERRQDEQTRELGGVRADVSALKSWREEMRARHSNTPAWIFGALSVVGSLIWMGITLYLSGGGTP